MLLAYVDESYTKVRYWMVALVCPEADLVPLTAQLDEVVAKAAFGHRTIDERTELHGYDLFHGKGAWSVLNATARARIAVYAESLDAIGSTGAHLIVRGVDRVGLERRYSYPDHPHAIVLSHLLERIHDLAAVLDQHALVIADEVDQADIYRHNLWHSQRFATTGYRSRKLWRIVDTIHFAPSKSSRLVQAADLVAFLHNRITSGTETDPRAVRANEILWSRIAGNVHHSLCWEP